MPNDIMTIAQLTAEVARLESQLEIITAENHTRAQLSARSLEDWAALRAELDALRGEGCREKKADEPESGPCGACIRCAEERGAYWALTELPHAGRPGMLPEDRAVAAVEAGRLRARMMATRREK